MKSAVLAAATLVASTTVAQVTAVGNPSAYKPDKPVAQAPITQPVAPSAPIAAIPTTNAVLRVGTEVPLRLLEELTTKGKRLRVGNRFRLETSEPVMINGVTVIPVGSPAVGEMLSRPWYSFRPVSS